MYNTYIYIFFFIPNNILHVTSIKGAMTLRLAQRVSLSIVIADFDNYNISRMVTKSATRVKLFEIQGLFLSLLRLFLQAAATIRCDTDLVHGKKHMINLRVTTAVKLKENMCFLFVFSAFVCLHSRGIYHHIHITSIP